MKRRHILSIALLATGGARADPPCCGDITSQGARLTATLDGMDVEHRWLAHEHINWKTGLRNRSADYAGPGKATHCSAFAAAVGLKLGVYMLRPPEHTQILLASAQTKWFGSTEGEAAGWRAVPTMQAAQALANQGELVVISYSSPNPHRPGHIVIVRPSLKSAADLAVQGPQVIQAATHNRTSYPAAQSFNAHPGAWPNNVRAFAHTVDWTKTQAA